MVVSITVFDEALDESHFIDALEIERALGCCDRHIYYVSRLFSCKVGCTLEETCLRSRSRRCTISMFTRLPSSSNVGRAVLGRSEEPGDMSSNFEYPTQVCEGNRESCIYHSIE